MKKFRFKAWFRVTPQNIVMDLDRANSIGTDNLAKIMGSSRKHKKNILIMGQTKGIPPRITNMAYMREQDAAEYKQLIKAIGGNVKILKES